MLETRATAGTSLDLWFFRVVEELFFQTAIQMLKVWGGLVVQFISHDVVVLLSGLPLGLAPL